MKPKRAPASIKPISAEIIARLREHAAERGLNLTQLANKMGISKTYVSRALGGTFTGNPDEFETKALAMLEKEANDRRPLVQIHNSGFLVEEVRQFLSTVEHTGDLGIAWAAAGTGLTCAAVAYQSAHPLAVYVTASKTVAGYRALRDAILDTLPSKRLQRGETFNKLLTRTFRGSGRLLIIDHGDLLVESARQWLAHDWHELTGCPVAVLGDKKIALQWAANERNKSRVGLAMPIIPQRDAATLAEDVLRAMLPDELHNKAARALVERLIAKGSIRSAGKHLKLCAELGGLNQRDAAENIKAANGLLLTNVKLAAA
jgi:DNA transposition AAA+ family ATPase